MARKTMGCVCAENDMHVEMILTMSDKDSFIGKKFLFQLFIDFTRYTKEFF